MASNPQAKTAKKILYLVSDDSYFCSHRLNLAKAAKCAGFEVAIATRCKRHQKTIEEAEIKVFPLKHFDRAGLNPWRQGLLLLELWKVYRGYQPHIVHQVAMKPVILGSVVAFFSKVPYVINALGGLGFLFTESHGTRGIFAKCKRALLRQFASFALGLACNQKRALLILQNEDDIKTLVPYIKREKMVLVKGSGIDMHNYPVQPLPKSPPFIIACLSRMLWDKGIGDLVEAAKILLHERYPVKVVLYGLPDAENPASISERQLTVWQNEGYIEWQGFCENSADAYSASHIAVLPSYYREGLPRTLLEGASVGRPIVTTDVPGCRETVIQGKNGYLVPAHDPKKLALALKQLIDNPDLLDKMGRESRKLVEEQFSEAVIHKTMLEIYFNALNEGIKKHGAIFNYSS